MCNAKCNFYFWGWRKKSDNILHQDWNQRLAGPPPTELNLKREKAQQQHTLTHGRSKIMICVVAQAHDWRLFPALGLSYFDGERQIIRHSGGSGCLVFRVQAIGEIRFWSCDCVLATKCADNQYPAWLSVEKVATAIYEKQLYATVQLA